MVEPILHLVIPILILYAFKPKLDIRNCGKRFVVDIAIQCLDYLLDKGE